MVFCFALATIGGALTACGGSAGTTALPDAPGSTPASGGAGRSMTAERATALFATGEIGVGPGFSDGSPHQLVRTTRDVEFVAVPTCASYPLCNGNRLPMYGATTTGRPGGFAELDAAHAPKAVSAYDTIGSSALAIDASDVIHVAYVTRDEGAYVTTFDTRTRLWGTPVRMGTTTSGITTQGREGVAIAMDRNSSAHVLWSVVGADGHKHVDYSYVSGGRWTGAMQVDDQPALGAKQGAIHPTLAFAPDGSMLVAWLVGDETSAYNTPDGIIRVREYHYPRWLPSVAIPESIVPPHVGYAATTIDQGPSLIVTGDGVAHLTFDDTSDAIRYWYSSDYAAWQGDRQPPNQATHDPALGPDGAGGLYLYGHGTPLGNINGHGNDLFRMHLPAGATQWSPFEQIVTDNNVDCSVSTRWSQYFHNFPAEIDYAYWNDAYPNVQYVGAN